MGGRSNHHRNGKGNQLRQRSKLSANRESSKGISSNTFSARRVLAPESQADILEMLGSLQSDGEIPSSVVVNKALLHVSLIEKNRIRKSLMFGIVGGYALNKAISELHHTTFATKEKTINAQIKAARLMDRRDNKIVLAIVDRTNLLNEEHQILVTHLSRMGLRGLEENSKFKPHVTIGELKGATKNDKVQVQQVLSDVFAGQISLELTPLSFSPDPTIHK